MSATLLRVFLGLTMVLYLSGFKVEQCPSGYRCRKQAVKRLVRSLNFQIQEEMEMEICEAGTFSPGGLDHCIPCEKGTYAAKPGAPACYNCPRGHMCPQANVEPERCPYGTSNNATRQTCCRSCPPGKFALFQGMFQCDDCPSGHKCRAGPKLPCEEEIITITTTSTTDADSTTTATTGVDSTTTTTTAVDTTTTATTVIDTTTTATTVIDTTTTATTAIDTTTTATTVIDTTTTATTAIDTTTTIATTPSIACGEPGAADDIRVPADQIYYEHVVLHGNTLHVCGTMEGRTTGYGTIKTYDGAKINGGFAGNINVIVLGNTIIGR